MARMTFVPVYAREAVGNMLERVRRRNAPFNLSEAVETIRTRFPELEISDAELIEAITGEAIAAGVKLKFDVLPPNRSGSLERWDNEGGAIKKAPTESDKREARRRTRNDTDGTLRRADEVKSRNQMF